MMSPKGVSGSMRRNFVPRIPKTGAYSLKELLNDVCLSILAHHALGTRDFNVHLNLTNIGEGIVGRCKGSPLATKALGGVLRNKMEPDE
jgi:hypothetical protein